MDMAGGMDFGPITHKNMKDPFAIKSFERKLLNPHGLNQLWTVSLWEDKG